MSRCGLRKQHLKLKSTVLVRYHAVNRTYFSDQLAFGKMTLLNFSFMFGWYEVISLSKVIVRT